jgi:PRTRC genetic system protein B
MDNVSDQFSIKYEPVKAWVLLKGVREAVDSLDSSVEESEFYLEGYDMSKHRRLVNAHPLSIQEMIDLSTLLQRSSEVQNGYLKCAGILPLKVLHVNSCGAGFAVWYTLPQEVDLLFSEGLDIPSGRAKVPGMVWRASKQGLQVFAFKGNRRPDMDTVLFHAPFFNTNVSGEVCMGNVRVEIPENALLEDFILLWEKFFWGSYFSHPAGGFDAVSMDINGLWRDHMGSGKCFPVSFLQRSSINFSKLLS